MRSCREITRLMSESQERTLSFSEWLELRMHTLICKGCRNYGRSLQSIRSAMQEFARGGLESNGSGEKKDD